MNYPGLEFGGAGGAIPLSPTINGGIAIVPVNTVIYAVVPAPSASLRATAVQGPSMSADHTPTGDTLENLVTPFVGNYSALEVTAGLAYYYLRQA